MDIYQYYMLIVILKISHKARSKVDLTLMLYKCLGWATCLWLDIWHFNCDNQNTSNKGRVFWYIEILVPAISSVSFSSISQFPSHTVVYFCVCVCMGRGMGERNQINILSFKYSPYHIIENLSNFKHNFNSYSMVSYWRNLAHILNIFGQLYKETNE